MKINGANQNLPDYQAIRSRENPDNNQVIKDGYVKNDTLDNPGIITPEMVRDLKAETASVQNDYTFKEIPGKGIAGSFDGKPVNINIQKSVVEVPDGITLTKKQIYDLDGNFAGTGIKMNIEYGTEIKEFDGINFGFQVKHVQGKVGDRDINADIRVDAKTNGIFQSGSTGNLKGVNSDVPDITFDSVCVEKQIDNNTMETYYDWNIEGKDESGPVKGELTREGNGGSKIRGEFSKETLAMLAALTPFMTSEE